ncbi:hypothetical protein RvY_14416 [Ramazzottius varieornatus]|uniref:Uncharacterized protein n=1 Tax=Ramazzottius varieornatus TaxID=947166 RepID=A0A1D1VV17_RAMVA|nr:hypothetical protein RvY_14416 [Ramazzottius varieornatus]
MTVTVDEICLDHCLTQSHNPYLEQSNFDEALNGFGQPHYNMPTVFEPEVPL